jgi:hypothetical protein
MCHFVLEFPGAQLFDITARVRCRNGREATPITKGGKPLDSTLELFRIQMF